MGEFDGLEVIPQQTTVKTDGADNQTTNKAAETVVKLENNIEVVPDTVKKETKQEAKAQEKAAPAQEETVQSKKAAKKAAVLKEAGIEIAAPATEQKATPATLPDEVSKELNMLREIANNKSVQAILAAERQGKDIFTAIDELKGVDPKKLNTEELFKIKLDRLGITDEDEVALELSRFGEKTKSEQLESVSGVRELLAKERDEKLKEFVSHTSSNLQQTEQRVQTTITEYQSNLNNLIGKKVLGIEITADVVKDIGDITVYAQQGDTPVSAQELIELNLFHRYKPLIINTLVEKGIEAGVDFVESKLNMTGGGSGTVNLPHPTQGSAVQQQVQSLNSTIDELYAPSGRG